MKKRVYKIRTQYIFEGVFEVVAESREDARQKVIQGCGMVMGGNVHSTLPDEEINWAFSTHPDVKRSADLPTAPFFREHRADKERSKETPMKSTLLLLTVS